MTVVEVVLTTSTISVTNLVMVLVEGFCLGRSPPTPPRRLFLLPEEFFSSTREMKSLVMDGTLNGWLFLLECGTSSSTADRLAGGAVTVTVFQTMLVWVSALETVTSTVDTTVEDSILTTRMVARCVAIRVVVSKIVLVIVTVSLLKRLTLCSGCEWHYDLHGRDATPVGRTYLASQTASRSTTWSSSGTTVLSITVTTAIPTTGT